jgi:NAD(P) transhydrogenase subunit alpha
MSVTNAISSVIIVGAIIAAGPGGYGVSKIFGMIGVILATVNIFGTLIYRVSGMSQNTNSVLD